jgi:hypothetical protein
VRDLKRFYRGVLSLLSLLALSGVAQAVPVQTNAPITGEIAALTLTSPGNVWSGGTMTVGGQVIILPANLLINLPNDYQTLQQLYANAPAACKATGESGLAKSDRCNSRGTGAQATILSNRSDSGNIIAGQVDISKALESVTGTVTYISYSDGYFMVNGVSGDRSTGVMVRVNDPPVGNPALGRHTIQKGLGCPAGDTLNCSPDVRFKVDPDNYTFCYVTGYPACIPTSADGTGDPNCPDSNRPPITNITSNNPPAAPPEAADSRRFAPISLGDSIKADGSFETVGGVTFLSAWSVRVLVDLTTRTVDPRSGAPDLTQPDYMIINEASWDAAAYPAGRVRGRLLSNSSNHSEDIDYFSVHYDPVNNAPHEQILYTTQFNKQQGIVAFNVNTGVFDSQIRFDFFPGAKLSGQEPCPALLGTEVKAQGVPVFPAGTFLSGQSLSSFCTGVGDSTLENFNLMVPAFREVMARGRRQHVVTGVALDIHGRPTQSGQYKLPTVISYGAFEDINLGMSAFPNQFSGTPWLMDRRLSPNGCAGACESAQQPLTPFPFEGIDPRNVSPSFGVSVGALNTPLPNPNRVFAFMDTTGRMTGQLAWPPQNPPALPILATPPLNIFPPFAGGVSASTKPGVPVIIGVLASDVAFVGTLDPASVKIATAPASGAVQVNPDGSITYTPAPASSGTISFSYTVANNFGAVSLPGTVNVTITVAPTAVNDQVTAPARSVVPINVTANDIAGTSAINLASLQIVAPLPAACGTLVNQLDGIVTLTAPAVAPQAPCSFNYTVQDLLGAISNVGTVSVTISAANVPPVANNDLATAIAGSTIAINVIGNDTSTSSSINPASVVVDLPSGGTALANANGTVSYTAPATPGTYFFAYTVQDNLVPPQTSNPGLVLVTVSATDVPPVANNDSAGSVVNTPVVINVLANDSSATSTLDPASIQVTAPSAGTAVANPNGTVTYTAPATPGSYAFTYTVKDRFTPAATSNIATVLVNVAAADLAPVANNDAAVTTTGSTITIPVLANDSSSTSTLNPASLVVTAATGGSAVANANGTVSYTAPATPGSYSFSYTVKDNFTTPLSSNVATVTVSVVAVNLPPVANNDSAAATTGAAIVINVLANDSSATSTLNPASLSLSAATGGTATANANGTVSYLAPATPGSYSFTYTVQDNAAAPATSNVATVTITVSAPVSAPAAVNDSASTAFNTPVTITVLANDTAGTNPINSASVAIATPAANGSATADPTGTVTYTPNLGFSGSDSFGYTVNDSTGRSSNVATVTVTVATAPGQSVAVSRAQFTLNGASWRVDGTVTPAPAAGSTLTIYNNPTAGVAPLVSVPVQSNGSWTWSSPQNAPQPDAQRKISVELDQNAAVKLEQVTVTVR